MPFYGKDWFCEPCTVFRRFITKSLQLAKTLNRRWNKSLLSRYLLASDQRVVNGTSSF